jgi:hypothetical protein
MGVLIKRSVRVKVVVTDQFKTRRTAELRSALAKLDAVKRRIEFEIGAISRRAESGAQGARTLERLNAGLRNNDRARSAVLEEIDRITATQVGSEYERGLIEGLVEVNVGDDFAKVSSCEIVVLDDKIIEIRDGLCPEPSETSP